MENQEEVSLSIEGQVFKVKKEMIIEHSDYFRAMFSGNYIEEEQQEIKIDMLDANSMNIILRYMELGLIDLSEYPLSTIGDVALAASFLQITELTKQIEYCLEQQLSKSNWLEIREIAQNTPSVKLENAAVIYGLFSFKFMEPEYVQSIQKLFWYLSHPYLHTDSELSVFKFGLEWIEYQQLGADTLLVILCCLDMNRLTKEDLKEMKDLIEDYVNSLAEKVIDCLYKLSTDFELSLTAIKANKDVLCQTYTERVYNEVLNLVKESIERKLKLIPIMPMWAERERRPEKSLNKLFSFSEELGFKPWLEIGDSSLWGWSITSWTPTKLVMVCGEFGRGNGIFMRDVKVYDIHRKVWIQHGVTLPVRRHAAVVVVEDSLYMVGGVGGFRVVLDSGIIYDLKRRTYRKTGKLPDPIQSPAICAHEREVFVVGLKNIYKYIDTDEDQRWVKSIDTDLTPTTLVSFRGHIYVGQNYFPSMYRFRPGIDKTLQEIACFTHSPVSLCNIGYKLIGITCLAVVSSEMLNVEEFRDDNTIGHPHRNTKIIWSKEDWPFGVMPSSCSISEREPPISNEISTFHQRYLTMYGTG